MNKTVLSNVQPDSKPLMPKCEKNIPQTDSVVQKMIEEGSYSTDVTESKAELITKLSDSACGSLTESEDSESKCQSSGEFNIVDREDEVDSFECDDASESSSMTEEESIDNNTFNVINTENSESQDISELTNDDSSNCDKTKENNTQGSHFTEEVESVNKSTPITPGRPINTNFRRAERSFKSESCEDSERSIDVIIDEEEEEVDFEPSLEEEESSKSRRSEDQTETSEDPAMEVSTDSSDKIAAEIPQENASVSVVSATKLANAQDQTLVKSGVFQIEDIKRSSSTSSIKARKRLGQNRTSKSNEFTIEIFESKKLPEIPHERQLNLENLTDQCDIKVTKPDSNKIATEVNSDMFETRSDELRVPDEISPSELTSSDSGNKSGSSLAVDACHAIKEESEESDVLSPIRSMTEDVHSATTQPPILQEPFDDASPKKSNPQQKSPEHSPTDPPHEANPTLIESINSNLQTESSPLSSNSNNSKPSTPHTTNPNSTSTSTSASTTSSKPVDNGEISTSCSQSTPNHNNHSQPDTTVTKKPTPMAFTVELDSTASDSSASTNSTKKLNIAASISQWAPKHRRNLSLTKVDEHKKVEERQSNEKPPIGRPRSGTVGSVPPATGKRLVAGYHSEGYFSSDQDEEVPKRTDIKSPKSPRTPDSSNSLPGLGVNNTQQTLKGDTLRKLSNKSEGRSCCKERERKPSVSELTGKSFKTDKKMVSESKNQLKHSPGDETDPAKDENDDVSETGTYTIDKDSPSLEEDSARNAIDDVFGVPTESEAELTSATTTTIPASTTDNYQEDETSFLSASENTPSISRNSPNWIHQWAAHVAEQTKPHMDPVPSSPSSTLTSPRGTLTSPRGQKLLLTPHDSDPRRRRKLPTPPSGVAQRPDLPSAVSQRIRVDKTKRDLIAPFRNASFESHESGADSDFDTSCSYPFNEDDRLAPSLKEKLRLTGLLPPTKTSPNPPHLKGRTVSNGSPRRPEDHLDPRAKKSPVDMGTRDASYNAYSPRRDENELPSDSSSEVSEPYKELPRTNDKNPPLKFNRAFSLRRARLRCDDPVPTQAPEKKKGSRPSSAGAAATTSRKTATNNKSFHSVDSSTVSSPRSCGFGSPRGIPSSQSVSSKGITPPSNNFDRTDGGRFSLRLTRTGSTTISVAKSPSKSTLKKDVGGSKKNASRSNSTLSSKEVDFQNWKRRKNYDPMKAAAEGKKKQIEKKVKNTQQPMPSASDTRSPSPPGSLLRSASFHGTERTTPNLRWARKACSNQPHYMSEDDGPYSLEEEVGPHPSPRHGSPLYRSPTSPHHFCMSPARQSQLSRGRRPSLGHSEEVDQQYQASRKVSLDESGSEGNRSPLNCASRAGAGNTTPSSGRPKTKMEALDNLVISTIHSLSVKVRTTSESLLQKLRSHFDEEGDRAALLEEVLSHLSESDQTLASGQTRSTSRELAGILRNLKKIEHALEVIDRVIIVGEEEYRDDDIDYVPTEWVEESDY